MPRTPDWDAAAAIHRCERRAWRGNAWRIHRATYAAESHGGSLKVSGRYHRGSDLVAEGDVFAALYLALSPETALAELIRHVTPELLPLLNSYRLSQLAIELADVVDARDLDVLGVELDELCSDVDHRLTQELGRAALDTNAEAILVPSATRLGDNLIVFPDNLRSTSRIKAVGYRHPRLYVEQSST